MKRIFGYSVVALQFFFQVSPAFAGVFQGDEQSIARSATEAGQMLKSSDRGDAAQQWLTSKATGQAADTINGWLNQFGTARTQLSVDSDFSLEGSALDVLLPVYNTSKNVLFTQLGMRDNDGRFTTNIGLGHRYFTDSGWMLGYNAFYDIDWRNTNRRYGVGLEAWRDYLKLSANSYKRLSDWRQSPTVTDYDERPADGWDIRAEGWLPAYPQLGGKLVYEQYYGNDVALFGESERQKNPRAITAGITYTPFPLLTAGMDYRRGKNGVDDTRLNLGLTFRIGESLASQLNSDYVGVTRSLAANRLELVNRNNDIVLDYRKQMLIALQLPPAVYGAELSTVTLTPQVNTKYGLSRITFDDTELRQAGGKIISNNGNLVTLQLPAWSATRQSVMLSGQAWDTHGNVSDVARTRILVSAAAQQQLAVSTNKTTASANGTDTVKYTLTVTGSNNQPVAGQSVSWQHSAGTFSGEGVTDTDGVAIATLSSQTSGVVRVSASTNNQTVKAADVNFVAAMAGVLLADRTQALANGQEAVTYTLTLKNTDGQPLSGKNVSLNTSFGQLSQTQGTTNQSGQISVKLTSVRAGEAVVNAVVDGCTISAEPVKFEASIESSIVVNKTTAIADGQDSIILTAIIRDAAGVPIAGQAVTWYTDNGVFTQRDAVTNAAGAASATLSSTQAGYARVSLNINGTTVNAPRISFTQVLNVTLQAGKTTALADGVDSITYTMVVRDGSGQLVKNKAVQWITDMGSLSVSQGITNAQGEATVTLVSTQAGTAIVSAVVDDLRVNAQPVKFTRVVRGVVTVEKDRVYPGTKQTVTLTLTDAAGNPVSSERVNWHTDVGILSQAQDTTDGLGRSSVEWESTIPGIATITVDATGQQFSAPPITIMSALAVSSVIGIDASKADGKNFGTRMPDNTWPGATVRVEVKNATGAINWKASSSAVSINGNVITVNSNPTGVVLTGTDADGQMVTLNMGRNWFAQSAIASSWLNIDTPTSAIGVCKSLNAGVATESQLNSIINEWGELYKYPGWTALANNWLYSSTTVMLNNRTYYKAFYLPQGTSSELSGPSGYYACY